MINSGAKGKKRTIRDKKIGRPRIYENSEGKNVTEQVELYFKQVIEEFLLPIDNQSISETYLRFKNLFSKYFPNANQQIFRRMLNSIIFTIKNIKIKIIVKKFWIIKKH